jgi:hypothetical protein
MAQMFVVFPLTSCTVKTPLVSTVKTTRPTCSVVEGPAGMSAGKRMRTLCPVVDAVLDPSGLNLVCVTAPLAFSENVAPDERFMNDSAEPLPAVSVRTTLPFLSVNSLTTWLPPRISIRKAKSGQAVPAGRSITASGGSAQGDRRPPAARRR